MSTGKSLKILFIFLSFFLGLWGEEGFSHAQQELIPLKMRRRPSDDLLWKGRVLSFEEAWALSEDAQNPLDLSLLDPLESELWTKQGRPFSDDISFKESAIYDFGGLIASNQGLVRFNIRPENFSDVLTVVMEKSVHTTLLRKNLLRKLGYNIPSMHYAKSMTLRFANKRQRDHFLSNQLPNGTYGAPSRWLGYSHENLRDEKLVMTFHDVVILRPSQRDHYNLAMGVPPKVLNSRTLRSLIIPYSLLYLGESVNKFPWFVGRIDNEKLILPHFAYGKMNATFDDVLWMARRLEKLTREDFEEIVREAFYPPAVEKILVEKIISRRNSLLEVLNIPTQKIDVNFKVSRGEELVEGQLTRENWSGYASRFAHGDPESPLKDFQYFVFSKIQNSTLSTLLDLVNEKLSFFNPTEQRYDFFKEQFQEGLTHFVETGEFKKFSVGTWFSPTLDGRLIMSRDIVLGNYLGTDHLVQLADTVGVNISLGGILGLENFWNFSSFSLNGKVSVSRTYTHLKPVQTLKKSFKEPYKNLIVPLLKRNLQERIRDLSRLSSQSVDDFEKDKVKDKTKGKEKKKDPRLLAVEEIISEIDKNLGVGESLIITDQISPSLLANGGGSFSQMSAGMTAGANGLFIKRFHIYRRDASTIQVYEDWGAQASLLLGTNFSYHVPLIRLSTSSTRGKYSVKLREVNINGDLKENPDLFSNALGLYYLLESGSGEVLDAHQGNYTLEGDFKDSSFKYSFLVWKAKYLKGDLDLSVKSSTGKSSEFLILRRGSQSGINYQSFVYELFNYSMAKWFSDWPVSIRVNPQVFKNPGQTLFGVSQTHNVKLEARVIKGRLSSPLLSLEQKREGWSASPSRLRHYIQKLNDEYGMTLFDRRQLENSKGLRLFNINVTLQIYERGIEKLAKIADGQLRKISRRYRRKRERMCSRSTRYLRGHRRVRTARHLIECGNLNILRRKNKSCQKIKIMNKKKGRCLLELAHQMEKDIEFSDIIHLIGEENIYLRGVINGFRRDSEILNDPIFSHTLGKIRSKYWSGAVQRMKKILNIQDGEFHGLWMREFL